ncbi:hypothetical protein Pyn_11226 [Prunus yedoensis var. nudiflora]|uniref:MLO-like protein n=1 Tax=Prunus yedoensis var. nudiflora TaxID=2094558 RepID=A0A314Z583_PRUYE|nr:hypothetical protein Pyn_11226 [Prunus yedoensis var. nudiflora]
MEVVIQQQRSLAETPTYSVASVVTVMVFVCLLVERSIYRFGRWLKKTRRKALFASLEKIKEELMLLGLISLLLAQSARWISEICVNSSLFTSQFYICSERDYSTKENAMLESSSPNKTEIPRGLNSFSHQCGEGHEPFVSYEGLEQLHRFLFVLGITHVLYSCLAVALAMSKIYSWRKWENLAELAADANLQGLNIYFWLSFIPAILVMLVGTKLQHVVSSLALEIVEQTGPATGTQVKPRDDLFWFGKPVILLRLIQFIIFQNAFEMATFLWSLWGLKERSCFMKNHLMIVIRLTSGVLVQFWCSYSTAPLNVIVTQMGSRCKKALVAESVRDSLHSWCKRVKERSRRDSVHSHATRSVCSLDTTIDERDEITVASGTLSRSSSLDSLHQVTVASAEQPEAVLEPSEPPQHEYSFRVEEYLSESVRISASQPPTISDEDDEGNGMEEKVDTLLELFQKT